jgi:dimethylargininase
MERGERTFIGDEPIDDALALAQHAAYCDALRTLGAEVITLGANREMPDAVFVEDTAIVLDELAVMMSMGAASRRGEPPAIEAALAPYRRIERVVLPATIDGGDVVRANKALYVGLSPRTNEAAVHRLSEILAPYRYSVTGIPVHGCLHLKTACSALPGGRFLVNADWIDVSPLPQDKLVSVPNDEPWAGDVLVVENSVIVSDAFPATIALLRSLGLHVVPVSVSEFAKAEGGVTCLSLVFWA